MKRTYQPSRLVRKEGMVLERGCLQKWLEIDLKKRSKGRKTFHIKW